MKPIHSAFVAAALLTASSLWAQRPPVATSVSPTAQDVSRSRSLPIRFTADSAARMTVYDVPVDASPGTQLAQHPRWMGSACPGSGPGGGCMVAQGSAGSAPGVTIRMTDGSVRGSRAARVSPGGPVTITATYRVGATLLVPHDRPHRLGVSLDGSEVMGFSCDGRAIRLQAPGGAGFRWEVYHGASRVDGGTSTGAPVDVPNPPHLAGPGGGPLQLTVVQSDPARLAGASDAWCKKYGCLQLAVGHGEHRIVVMPVLTRGTPYALRSVGLSVAGVSAFALANVEVARNESGPLKWMSPEARTP